MADLIVILTEQALSAGDAARIAELHEGETLACHVLVPADTQRNLLVDVVDHLWILARGAQGRPGWSSASIR